MFCPACGSGHIARVPRQSSRDRLVRFILLYCYSCKNCERRFYGRKKRRSNRSRPTTRLPNLITLIIILLGGSGIMYFLIIQIARMGVTAAPAPQ